MPLSPHRACINCGDPVTGPGDLCSDCTPADPASVTSEAAACPYCKKVVPWEQMRRYSRSHEEGRIEVLYYCPECRGVLESACWMER